MSQRHPGAGESAALNFSESVSECEPIESLEDEWRAACAAVPTRDQKATSPAALASYHLTYGQQTRIAAIVRENLHSGIRHYVARDLSGALATAGVSKEQTQEIFYDLFDNDPEIDDRLRCVDDTYQCVRSGLPVSGFRTLQNHLPRHALLELKEVLPLHTGLRVQRASSESTPNAPWRKLRRKEIPRA